MRPRLGWLALLAALLWLAVGLVAGWTLSRYEHFRREDARGENPMVHRLVDELGLDRHQRELLATAIEGNRQRIAALARQEESLNPWARGKISEIRDELDLIIQSRILSPAQQRHYWALKDLKSSGQER